MEQLTRHPLSALWGDMPEDQYREFVAGIEKGHIRQMIMTLDEKILDGWHRYKACLELGIEPFVAEYTESDPAGYVIRQNAMRRHLTRTQYRVGILLSHGIRGWGEHGHGRGTDSVPLPPSIQDHIEKHGGSRQGWMDALAIVKAGHGPEVMAGEPAQPFLDQIHETKAETDDEVSADSQPDESLAPGSGDETDSPDEGTDDVHTGDDGGHRPATGESETTQPDVGPEGDGQGIEPPTEKPPSPKQRLEAERDAARMDVQEKAEENERLERALREARAQMSEYPHEREKAATEREAIISTLRSQLNEYMVRANEDSQSLRYWKREAKQPCRKCGTEWEFTND